MHSTTLYETKQTNTGHHAPPHTQPPCIDPGGSDADAQDTAPHHLLLHLLSSDEVRGITS